jgi:hypothetical protein
MGVMLDYRKGTEHSLSPFFGAGTAKPIDWIHREEGIKTTAAALCEGADSIDNGSSGSTAVLSAQISGIAGYTKYQGQITMVELPI